MSFEDKWKKWGENCAVAVGEQKRFSITCEMTPGEKSRAPTATAPEGALMKSAEPSAAKVKLSEKPSKPSSGLPERDPQIEISLVGESRTFNMPYHRYACPHCWGHSTLFKSPKGWWVECSRPCGLMIEAVDSREKALQIWELIITLAQR